MPNRILRPWVDSEAVNSLGDAAEVFFVRLIMCADDYGRFYGAPQLLKSYLYPMKDKRVADIARLIAECVKAGLIADYEVSGKRYLQILRFNQRARRTKSRFPAPCSSCNPMADNKNDAENDSQTTVKRQSNDGHMTVICQSIDSKEKKETFSPLHPPFKKKDKEFNSSDTNVSSEFCLEPENSGDPSTTKKEKIFFDYEGDAKIHGITSEQMDYWQNLCPALDVESEIKRAELWLDGNRKNRKTDVKRFLSNWLSRAQDNARCQNVSKRKPIRDYTGL